MQCYCSCNILLQSWKEEDDFRAKKGGAGGSSSAERFLRQTPDQQVLEKAIAFQRANAFKSENPSFLVAMLPSYIQSTLVSNPTN